MVSIEVPRSRGLLELARRCAGCATVMEEPHVSLSRPFSLWQHEIDPFVARLRACLELRCRPFDVAMLHTDPILR